MNQIIDQLLSLFVGPSVLSETADALILELKVDIADLSGIQGCDFIPEMAVRLFSPNGQVNRFGIRPNGSLSNLPIRKALLIFISQLDVEVVEKRSMEACIIKISETLDRLCSIPEWRPILLKGNREDNPFLEIQAFLSKYPFQSFWALTTHKALKRDLHAMIEAGNSNYQKQMTNLNLSVRAIKRVSRVMPGCVWEGGEFEDYDFRTFSLLCDGVVKQALEKTGDLAGITISGYIDAVLRLFFPTEARKRNYVSRIVGGGWHRTAPSPVRKSLRDDSQLLDSANPFQNGQVDDDDDDQDKGVEDDAADEVESKDPVGVAYARGKLELSRYPNPAHLNVLTLDMQGELLRFAGLFEADESDDIRDYNRMVCRVVVDFAVTLGKPIHNIATMILGDPPDCWKPELPMTLSLVDGCFYTPRIDFSDWPVDLQNPGYSGINGNSATWL